MHNDVPCPRTPNAAQVCLLSGWCPVSADLPNLILPSLEGRSREAALWSGFFCWPGEESRPVGGTHPRKEMKKMATRTEGTTRRQEKAVSETRRRETGGARKTDGTRTAPERKNPGRRDEAKEPQKLRASRESYATLLGLTSDAEDADRRRRSRPVERRRVEEAEPRRTSRRA